MQRIAIIDLGTNTFKILLADVDEAGKSQVILNNKIPVKLGDGLSIDNQISVDAFQRGINVLRTFKTNIIDYFQVDQVYAFATSAIRSATNGAWFVAYVKQELGITIEVISGHHEAELVYKGVKKAVAFTAENYLVCDIGGGSTEFIIGNKNDICWKQSFPLGAARMMEAFSMSDPIQPSEIAAIESYLEEHLQPLFAARAKYPVTKLVGSSGAFTTLARMAYFEEHQQEMKERPTSKCIPKDVFEIVRDKIQQATHQERKLLPGITLIRMKMMLPAIVFVNYIVKKFNFEEVYFSDYALKEGVIAHVIDQVNNSIN